MRRAVTPAMRMEIFKRDGFACQYCGARAPDTRLVVDHVDPHAPGGSGCHTNLITACHTCNIGKSDVPLSAVRIRRGNAAPPIPVPNRSRRGPKKGGAKPRNTYLHDETVELLKELGGKGGTSGAIEALADVARRSGVTAEQLADPDGLRIVVDLDAASPAP